MSIAIGDPRKMPPVRKGEGDATEAERTQRRRSGVAAQAAPSQRNDPRGHFINFNTPSTAAAKPSVGGTLSFFDTVEVKRAEQDARLGKLPPAVVALPKQYPGLAIEHLETVAAVYEGSRRRSGQPTPIHRQDLAKALGVTAEKAEAILGECERRGLIRRQAALTASVPHFVPLI